MKTKRIIAFILLIAYVWFPVFSAFPDEGDAASTPTDLTEQVDEADTDPEQHEQEEPEPSQEEAIHEEQEQKDAQEPADDPPGNPDEENPEDQNAENEVPGEPEPEPDGDPSDEPSPDTPDEPQPGTITLTKQLIGDIWHIRCDYMDGETFHAGGGIWKRDVIKNPEGNTSKEGHRSNKCGDDDHWVIWVGADGVPYRMDEIKSGATGGTLPTVIYRPRYNLSSEEIYGMQADDADLVWKYSQNFMDPMSFSEIRIGQRVYWTTQNGNQVWYHTGVPYKSNPTFMLFINGTAYPLVAGGTVEIDDLLPGIYEISEAADSAYYLGAVSSSSDVVDSGEWSVSIELKDGEDAVVNWPNVVITPEPKNPPNPPKPPVVVTSTPTPTLTPSPTPSPTPTPTETPSPTPEPTATATPEVTSTPTPEITATPSLTPTEVPTATPPPTPPPAPAPTASLGPTATPTDLKPTETPTATATVKPTATPSPRPSETPTSAPVVTAVPTATPITTRSPVPTVTNTSMLSPKPTQTTTPHVTATPSVTTTQTQTATPPAAQETPTASPEPSATPTASPTQTVKPTATPAPTHYIDEEGREWFYRPQPSVPPGMAVPKMPGLWWTIITDYETALGITVMINHAGDCFD